MTCSVIRSTTVELVKMCIALLQMRCQGGSFNVIDVVRTSFRIWVLLTGFCEDRNDLVLPLVFGLSGRNENVLLQTHSIIRWSQGSHGLLEFGGGRLGLGLDGIRSLVASGYCRQSFTICLGFVHCSKISPLSFS